MTHSFDVEIAQKYGVDEAILLSHLFFWIQKNEANKRHFHDGRYWTYNSIEAFSLLFPYWSKDHIRRLLKKMEDKKIILTGNFNAVPYDRTCWYAIADSLYSILQKCGFHLANVQNGSCESAEPIPDSNPDSNPDKKPPKPPTPKTKAEDIFFGHDFSDRLKAKLRDWLAYKAEKRDSYKPTGLKSFMTVISNKLKVYSEADILSLIDDCMANNWQGIIWDRLKGKENDRGQEDNWEGIPKL